MFLGALWVPYLRDPRKLEAVLTSTEVRTAAAIFSSPNQGTTPRIYDPNPNPNPNLTLTHLLLP